MQIAPDPAFQFCRKSLSGETDAAKDRQAYIPAFAQGYGGQAEDIRAHQRTSENITGTSEGRQRTGREQQMHSRGHQ